MSPKTAEVTIKFPDSDKKRVEHLFKAEKELRKAGVDFDTGFDFTSNTRDWEFDWSLKGAEVMFVRFKEENNSSKT